MFINCLHIIPPRQYPESLRQPPDTSQKLSRQPSDIPRHLGEKEPADQNYSNWICVNQYQIIPPPRQYPDSFRQPKTTPRNLPDTLQTPQNRKLNGQSRVNERKGTSQLKQHSMFLHWSFNNWFVMITIQAVSIVIQTPSRHLLDTLRHIPDNPKPINIGWGYNVTLIDINPIRVNLISWFLLSQVPRNVWRLSRKCLRGVWGLSEWLWILSGDYDVQAIDKHPMD